MRISKKFESCYISCLPARVQAGIKREVIEELKNTGIDRAEIKMMTSVAMASRVADLESLLDIRYYF